MRPLIYLLVVFLAGHSPIIGQSQELDRLKADIAYYADISVNAQQSDHRIRAGERMVASLDSFLTSPGNYEISLDSIPWISVVHGDDFRMLTWQLKISDEEFKYGGVIQWPDRLVRFKDTRPFINGAAYSTFTPAGWYGCLYYRIIPFERDKVRYYVLLGYNAENSMLNTKVADILDLSGPEPRLGLPVFTGQEDAKSRLMITYADVSPARMFFDAQLEGIVYDHLEVLPGVGSGGEALPVPDGSMEAWLLKKGNWVYKEEVYDVKQSEPPMTDERKNRNEDKDILGRPKKE